MKQEKKSDKQAYKYTRIKTDLSLQILGGQLHPHERVPSLNEITRKYKVSKITARRVLNDLTTEELVYSIRGKGTFVADPAMRKNAQKLNDKSNQIGVVCMHGSGFFFNDIIMGIDKEAYSRNIQINLCLSNNSYEREAENLQRLVEQGIDKILLFMVIDRDENTINPNIPLYLRLQEKGISLLLLGCRVTGFPIPTITYDDYNAFRRLVKFLKEKQCKRLIYITRVDNASTTVERLSGFKDGLLESGLPYNEKSIVRVEFSSCDSISADAYHAFNKYLKGNNLPDAILCSDEMIAGGVFKALEESGLPERAWPLVGGMGSKRNLHVLRGHPYVLLEDDTKRLGSEAAAIMLRGELPRPDAKNIKLFRQIIPVPLRVPKKLRSPKSVKK